MWVHGNAPKPKVLLFSLNSKVLDIDPPLHDLTLNPLFARIPPSSGSPGVMSSCSHCSLTKSCFCTFCTECCWRREELKLFLFLQLPSKPSSQSLRVGNWSERKTHRLPRLPKRHSHDDMLLLAQLGIPSSPSSLNEDSLSTTSELLSTRRARRIPKVLAGWSGSCWGQVTCLQELANSYSVFSHHWKLLLYPKRKLRSKQKQ